MAAARLSLPSDGAATPPVTDIPPVVATHELTRWFGDVVAVDAVDLVVQRGAVFGLLGPDGAGK